MVSKKVKSDVVVTLAANAAVCQNCKAHKNNPSFCKEKNAHVGRKSTCEKFKL